MKYSDRLGCNRKWIHCRFIPSNHSTTWEVRKRLSQELQSQSPSTNPNQMEGEERFSGRERDEEEGRQLVVENKQMGERKRRVRVCVCVCVCVCVSTCYCCCRQGSWMRHGSLNCSPLGDTHLRRHTHTHTHFSFT